MQINGDDFLKKVQLKQEKEELEKKLNKLDETRISMANINLTNNLNNAYKGFNDESNEMDRLQKNIDFENANNHEFENIMLDQPLNNDDNKKKYLILGIVLVVLFLLTIIIIRLLTADDDSKKDSFTSNNSISSQMKAMSENSNNIEDRYQRILDDRAKRESNETSINRSEEQNLDERLNQISETKEEETTQNSRIILRENENTSISNETIDETIKKIEEKKESAKSLPKKEQSFTQNTFEAKKSIRDLVEGSSTKVQEKSSANVKGFFIQIGAFSKQPSESYLKNISKQGFSYKLVTEDIKGKTFNKLLIGPYKTKAQAQADIQGVKDKLNIKSTFIVAY